jgi:uncharacterized protein YegJ (DUF2314 family)
MQDHRIAAALLMLGMLGCSTPLPTEHPPGQELALRRAVERAQATLDEFLTKAKQQPAGTKDYALKVRVEDQGRTEDFWVEEFTWSDGAFTGRINDEPRVVSRVQRGQVHAFNRSQVADWRYLDETRGKVIGNFTECARLSEAPAAQADEAKRRDNLDCS